MGGKAKQKPVSNKILAERIKKAYKKHGSIRPAAEELGMPKSTFADLCKRLGINTKSKRRR